jgi:hypothetical protein
MGHSSRLVHPCNLLTSDIMGTTADHTNFNSIGAQLYSNNSFELEPCTLSVSYPMAMNATRQADGCSNFDVWATS